MFPTEHHTRAARLAAKLAVDLAAPEGRRWEMWEVGSLHNADGHPMMTSPAKPVTHPQSSPLPPDLAHLEYLRGIPGSCIYRKGTIVSYF